MTSPAPDAATIGALTRAAREGDVRKALALFSECLDSEVILHRAGEPAPPGTLRGREQVLAAVERAAQFVEVTRIEIERIGPEADCLVAFLHIRWRAEAFAGRRLTPPPEAPMAQVWRFRHGRIVEIRPFSFDQPTIPLP